MKYNLYKDYGILIKYNKDLVELFKNWYNNMKNKMERVDMYVKNDEIVEIDIYVDRYAKKNEFINYVEQKYKVKIKQIDKKGVVK